MATEIKRILIRRDTESNWDTINPVLSEGELGYVTDEKKLKVGDGVNNWRDLGYIQGGGQSIIIDGEEFQLIEGKMPMVLIPSFLRPMQVVANIAARNAIVPEQGLTVYVEDATSDPAVTAGGAEYQFSGSVWNLIEKGERQIVNWEDIHNKPTNQAPSAHTHNAVDINAGTVAITRLPTGTSSSTIALGNHTHAGVYEPVLNTTQKRTTHVSTANPSGGTDGDVWLKYI